MTKTKKISLEEFNAIFAPAPVPTSPEKAVAMGVLVARHEEYERETEDFRRTGGKSPFTPWDERFRSMFRLMYNVVAAPGTMDAQDDMKLKGLKKHWIMQAQDYRFVDFRADRKWEPAAGGDRAALVFKAPARKRK